MRGSMKQISDDNLIRGYTLIQLAVAIMILGLMIAPAAVLYNNYKKTTDFENTYKNVSASVDNIQLRRSTLGAYPCPAPIDAARDDAAYGGALSDCPGTGSTAIATGTCENGICVEAGRGGERVLVGAVPFRELQLDEMRSYDAYGSRLLYSVTEAQTDEDTFNPMAGAIYIAGENGESVIEPEGGASFIVLSPGRNHVGGYTMDGVLRQSCAGVGRDRANCNPGFEGGTPKAEARYVAAFESSVPGTNFFDDQLSYFTQVETPYWRPTTNNQNDIQDLSPNNVGIGNDDPAAEMTITSGASDSLRVSDALIANQICNESGECFEPSTFTTDPKIKCGPNEHMVGIKDGEADCRPDTTPVTVKCPAGQVLKGVDPTNGKPICSTAPLKSCPAATATLCDPNDISAGVSTHGAAFTFNRGDCRSVKYTCNNGNWTSNTPTGKCVFVAPVPDTYQTCGITCPKWYSGKYCNNYRTVCTGTVSLGNTQATDCVCVGGSEQQTTTCSSQKGSAWKGTATRTLTVSPPNCTSSYSPWDLSACTCVNGAADGATQWVSNGSCASGFNGVKQKEQRWVKATCSWQDTGVTKDTCTCNTTPIVENVTVTCGDPTCEKPDKPDVFTTPINPTTCTKGTKVKTQSGSCAPNTFQWKMLTATGATGTTSTTIGSGCDCSDYKSGNEKICGYAGDPNKYIYKCKCE